MDRGLTLLGSFGLGAGLMYFFDPLHGRRRRHLLRDRLVSLANETCEGARATARDLAHRARGAAAEARALVAGGEVDDRVLEERVRSRMGRYVSHPGSIEVTARGGKVTLAGPILAREVDRLLDCVTRVPGVKEVESRLEVHRQAGNVPGLQGGVGRPGERRELMQENWSPATRLLVGAAGCGLFAWGTTQRAPTACVLGTLGLALAARGLGNVSFGRMFGVTGGRRAVDIQKTITIAGPVERVFPFFAEYNSFPRFMRHLREVRALGRGRSHWVAEGPGGVPVSWDAEITRFEPNRLIAWRSVPGSVVANAGLLRFEPVGAGTRVTIRLSYNPPGGVLGHFAAALFGADPKSAMDEDLVRLKSLIEEGITSAPGKGHVARQDLAAGHAASPVYAPVEA